MLEYHDKKIGKFSFLGSAMVMDGIVIDTRLSTNGFEDLMADLKITYDWSNEELTERREAIRKYSRQYRQDKSPVSSIKRWEDALASEDVLVRSMVAINGQFPEITSKDTDPKVRLFTLKTFIDNDVECGLSENDWINAMVHDESEDVRVMIAKLGIHRHLDVLVHDDSERVREAVALNGFHDYRDTLITDSSVKVRRAVTCRLPRRNLQDMIKDDDVSVRYLVASFGTDEDCDALIDDDIIIKAAIVECGNDDHRKQLYASMPNLAQDEQMLLKEAFAKADYNIAELACDKDPIVRLAVAKYSSESSIKKTRLSHSVEVMIRKTLAERGICLDVLVDDPNVHVRCKVAEMGSNKYLELLTTDPMTAVRLEVVKRGYNLEALSEDKDIKVRLAAIEQLSVSY